MRAVERSESSVGRRGIGAASGAATLFRTIGGSLGVSLLGTLYAQNLQSTLSEPLGAAAGGRVAGGQLSPAMLAHLPEGVRGAFQAAVTTGVHTAFGWAAAVAVVAVVAAWLVRKVPLRGSGTGPAVTEVAPAA